MGIVSVMLTGCTQGKDAEPTTSSEVVEAITEEQSTGLITTKESQEEVTQDGYCGLMEDYKDSFTSVYAVSSIADKVLKTN